MNYKKGYRRAAALLLVFAMLFSGIGMTVFATGTNSVLSDAGTESNAGGNSEESESNTEGSSEEPESNTEDSSEEPEPNTEDSSEESESNTEDSSEEPEPNTEDSSEEPESNTENSSEEPESESEPEHMMDEEPGDDMASAGMPDGENSGEIQEFPPEGMPEVSIYRQQEEGLVEVPLDTVMNLGEEFLLGFIWPAGKDLENLGIEDSVKYRLCRIPAQVAADGTEFPIYTAGDDGKEVAFATIYVGNDSEDDMRDVWITFQSHLHLVNVSAYFGCRLREDPENDPEDGVIKIEIPGEKHISIPVQDFLPKGPALEKTAGTLDDSGKVTWTVSYTAPESGYQDSPYVEEKIESPTVLVDTLPEGMEYVEGSAKVNGSESADNPIYDPETRSLSYSLSELNPGASVELTYDTRLTDATVHQLWMGGSGQTFSNSIRGLNQEGVEIEKLSASANVHVDQEWINGHAVLDKSGSYNMKDGKRTAEWKITVNTVGRAFEYLYVEDTLGKGLKLESDTIKINGTGIDPNSYAITENNDGTTVVKMDLWKEGKELIVPVNDKYVITYETTVSEDYFQQTPDENGNPMIGDEDVKNAAKLFWKYQSGYGSGETGTDPTIEKEPVLPEGLTNTMLGKAGISYEQSTHILTWEITINPNSVPIVSAHLEDLLPNDGIVERDGKAYEVTLLETEETLQDKIETGLPVGASIDAVERKYSEDGERTIGFGFDIKNLGTAQLTFQVQAEIDASFWTTNQDYINVWNDAELNEVVVSIDGGTHELEQNFRASGLVTPSQTILEKASASYDLNSHQMTWKLTINKDEMKGLNGATVTDTLPQGMSYVSDSTMLNDVQQEDTEAFGVVGTDEDGRNTVVWNLPPDMVDGKIVTLTYKAEVDVNSGFGDNNPFLESTDIAFSNHAALKAGVADAGDTAVDAGAVLKNPLLTKEATSHEGNKVSYRATLNPHGVQLLPDGETAENKQLYLTDTMPGGLVLDLDSVQLYKATVRTEGTGSYEVKMENGEQVPLEGKIDYRIDTAEDGSSRSIFRVAVDDATPYILTYDAYVVQTNVTLSNDLSLTGSILPEGGEFEHEHSDFTLKAFGAAMMLPDSNWSIKIKKVDQDGAPITFTEDQLNSGKKPAVFGLYTAPREDAMLLKAVCDTSTGVCVFSQPPTVLEGVTELYLKELEPPTGYAVMDTEQEYIPLTDQLDELKTGADIELSIENIALSGRIVVTVTDDEKKIIPSSGTVTLYKDKECKEPIATGTVGEDGTVTFEGLRPDKDYYLKPDSTPEGYWDADTEVSEVTFEEGKDIAEVEIIFDKKVSYRVEHYLKQPDGSYKIVEEDIEIIPSKRDETVTAEPNNYSGYEVNEKESENTMSGVVVEPNADGTGGLVLKVYYDPIPYVPGRGNLTVSKTVEGSGGDTEREFRFTVTLSNKALNGVYGDLEFTDGVAEFTLKHGESKTAKQLIEGIRYTVEEIDSGEYTVTKSGETGTIRSGQTQTAHFINAKDEEESETESENESESEPVTEPESESGSEPETEPESESGSEPETEPQSESGSEPETEPQSESGSEPETEPQSESGTEAETGRPTTPGQPGGSSGSGGNSYRPGTSGGNSYNSGTSGNSYQSYSSSSGTVPSTGDESNAALWMTLMGGSGLGIVSAAILSKKRRKKEQRRE